MELRWSELPNTILRIGIPAEIVSHNPWINPCRDHAVGQKVCKFSIYSQYFNATTNIFRQALNDRAIVTFQMPCSIYF